MPVAVSGYTLKQFLDDERLWTGHEAYEGVRMEFAEAPEGYADPLTIPDDCHCQVSGGLYVKPGASPRPFEELLKQWLRQLEHVRVCGTLPKGLAQELQQWFEAKGAIGVRLTPSRTG